MRFFKSPLLPILIIALFTCLIFFEIFLKGLYPIPADLLVSFYFPWYSGDWERYNHWITPNELLAADAIRQIYLWKECAADQFKKGQIPLFGPIVFMFLSYLVAWVKNGNIAVNYTWFPLAIFSINKFFEKITSGRRQKLIYFRI